jgi:hypothetical protein
MITELSSEMFFDHPLGFSHSPEYDHPPGFPVGISPAPTSASLRRSKRLQEKNDGLYLSPLQKAQAVQQGVSTPQTIKRNKPQKPQKIDF